MANRLVSFLTPDTGPSPVCMCKGRFQSKDAGMVSGLIMAWCPLPFRPVGVLLSMCNWGGRLDPRSDRMVIFHSGRAQLLPLTFSLKHQREVRPKLLSLTSPSGSQPRGPATCSLTLSCVFKGVIHIHTQTHTNTIQPQERRPACWSSH